MSEMERSNPGAPFKTSRERLGLSINDVAVATKINPRILKALEEGDKSGLPAHSFARGFIRSYAAYLKIDAQPILEAYSFQAEPVSAAAATLTPNAVATPTKYNNPAPSPEKTEPTARKEREVSAFKDVSITSKAILIGGLLVLVGVIFGVRKVIDKYAQERMIEPAATEATTTPAEDTATDAEATAAGEETAGDDKNADQSAAKEATNEVAKDATPAATSELKPGETKPAEAKAAEIKPAAVTPPPSPVTTAATPALKPAEPVKPVEAKPATVAEVKAPPAPAVAAPTPKPAVVTPPVAAVAPPKPAEAAKPADTAAKPAAAAGTPQEVILEALDTVEVTAVIDGVSQKIKLSPEAVHTIKAKTSIRLDIADGGMVNIIHNGRDRGVPGDLGKPTQVKYP